MGATGFVDPEAQTPGQARRELLAGATAAEVLAALSTPAGSRLTHRATASRTASAGPDLLEIETEEGRGLTRLRMRAAGHDERRTMDTGRLPALASLVRLARTT